MIPRRRGILLLALIPWLGCSRRPPAGTADQPPQPRFAPGIYADVNPRWSHDGRQIAFLRSTPDHRMQLHLAGADLERPLALLESELLCPDRPYRPARDGYASGDSLAWSPDDRQIAFERIEWFTFDDGERLPGTSLWTFDTRSGRVLPLAVHPPHYFSIFYYYHTPAWSPDGRYLAFVAEGIGGQRGLCVRPVFAQKPQETHPRFDNYEDTDWPTWQPVSVRPGRPASSGLVYRQSIRRAYNIPPTETLRRITPGGAAKSDAGELWRITSRAYRRPAPVEPDRPVVLRIGQPVWAESGDRIAFTLTPDARDEGRYEIWVWERATGAARRVSPPAFGCLAPVWIGEDSVAFLSPQGAGYRVCLVNTRSGAMRTLGTIGSADCDWSPDRSRIVWAAPPTGRAAADDPTTLHLFSTGLRVPKL